MAGKNRRSETFVVKPVKIENPEPPPEHVIEYIVYDRLNSVTVGVPYPVQADALLVCAQLNGLTPS